jgi:thiopeptide-type bacteriocin biosynthesis protein
VRPLSRFLLRAPLLPLSSLRRPAAAIFRDALAQKALAWASPSLPGSAGRARENYARRAAFRPTPHGLWAGVLMGELGARLDVATGRPRPHLTVSHSRWWAEARARLDEPAFREVSRLRVAPSLIADGRQAEWLAFGEETEAVTRAAEIDEPLARALDAAADWAPWPELRAAAGVDDEWLLRLVDDGLLVSDADPPLIGPAPPATDELQGAHAVLTFDGTARLPRSTVERAARLAPLLWRLQQALAPPAAERDLVPMGAVEVAAEVFGAGAFDLAALMRGDYGVLFDGEPAPRAASLELLAHLAGRLHEPSLDLDAAVLDSLLPAYPSPPTCELFLQPTKDGRGRGWLLGLHGPAGSSWGRFAHALGAPLLEALTDLADAEVRARPGEHRLDVCFAPSRALADLAAHPPLRRAALALLGWPERALPLSSLELVVDAGALEPLAMRAGDRPLAPSPLHRLRSSTAPAGAHRLLAAWSLQRQHAPWAFSWGPLASLPRLPRVTVDGFVIAPASWRLPSGDFRRWRKALPRHVQIGEEDELLLVDLHARGAEARIAKLRGRAWEVWPPLDQTPDRDGRRLEAVIALVDDAPSERTRAAIDATSSAGRVGHPMATPAPGWLTFKLFGAPDRADGVLLGVVRPLLEEADDKAVVDRWFYLRYVDAPGRPHLRLRLLPRPGRAAEVERLLHAWLEPARAAADVVAVERTEYFRERARWGDADVERIFQLDSRHCLTLLDEEDDPIHRLVRALDAIASGLDPAPRRALAARRRQVHPLEEDLAPEFRARQRALIRLLADPPASSAAVRRELGTVDEKLLPALLHLSVNRLDPASEARAYYFWERALDGLLHQPTVARSTE